MKQKNTVRYLLNLNSGAKQNDATNRVIEAHSRPVKSKKKYNRIEI